MKKHTYFFQIFIIPILGCFFFSSFGDRSSSAHDDPNAPVPSFRALKVDAPLTVDGLLDEPFWRNCEVTSNFIDIRSQKPAEQQTLVRVAYTRKYLYIAVECLDDNIAEIRASERREDRSFDGDDWIEVHFDPPHNHRGKYAFFSNPLGARADASEGPSGVFNRGWTAEWDLAATIQADRWVFEMRIPFGVMNYERKDDQTWGINFTRCLRRTDVTSFWNYNPTDYYKPRHFGHLTGLDLADSEFDRNFEIAPYVSTRVDFNGDTDTIFQTGLDASFRLTPAITTAWTINPDFGQVEADDDTIELRDTERFLSEKRLFFREGEELLNLTHRLYYSRRFTDIQAGAKVSGRWNDTNFALLNIQGDAVHDETRHGNTTVFRALQDIGEKSSLGYYLSDAEFDDGHSRVAGVDGYFFLTDDWRYRMQGSVADDRMENEIGRITKDRIDYLGSSSLIYNKYPWDIHLDYTGISEGFNPTLGYIPRRDIFGPSFRAAYNHASDERWYKRLYASFDTKLYENENGKTILRDYSFDTDIVFHNDYGILLGHDEDFHDPYDNTRTVAGVSMNNSDLWKSMEVSYGWGQFEAIDYDEVNVGKRFKPIDRLPIRYEFTIRFEDDPIGKDETVWLNRIVFDFYFTDKMWIKSSVQNRANSIHNLSVIYGWEFVRNAHWYLVFNSVGDKEETGNSIFTKIAYTF
ncbi:MAG: hypothetical protein C4527_23570 [Candidatus Omnitrophota bacterium]|jgi:hypothetical protein|nr:MAG: hypothetical protein C4527_23570 [Candidatus Omnitrophota bacterium]